MTFPQRIVKVRGGPPNLFLTLEEATKVLKARSYTLGPISRNFHLCSFSLPKSKTIVVPCKKESSGLILRKSDLIVTLCKLGLDWPKELATPSPVVHSSEMKRWTDEELRLYWRWRNCPQVESTAYWEGSRFTIVDDDTPPVPGQYPYSCLHPEP